MVLNAVTTPFTGRPETQPGSRDPPKCHDDRNPNCGLAGMTSRYVVLSAAPHPAYLPGNNAGAYHPMSKRLLVLGLTRGCRPDTRHGLDRDHGHHRGHGPDLSHRDLLLSRNQPGSRDLPRCPCYPSPNCSLPGKQIRSAAVLAELCLANQPGNSAACRRQTNTK